MFGVRLEDIPGSVSYAFLCYPLPRKELPVRLKMACAPGLWPREKTKASAPESERKVYDALKDGLPAGWYAWHSMKLLDKNGWEGEGDFVIAIPDRGFLVLEVKGGQITKRDGRWYQYDREMEKGPREQAHQFAKLLDSRLRAKGFTAPGYGILTIFPDTAFDNAPTQDDVCRTLLGEMDLPYLNEALKSHLDTAFTHDTRPAVGNWINALHELWDEVWTADIKLGTRHELSEEARIQLDKNQLAVLNNIGRAGRVLVTGGAGSGKSLLARKRALMAAEAGKRVLVFCFTDALVRHLRQTISNDLVQIKTVGRFAAELMRRAGMAEQIDESSPEFWKNAPFQAAADALPPDSERPDIVIVDEAQDLGENEWYLIQEMARDRDCWVFYDPKQAFWPDRKIPDWVAGMFPCDLPNAYRCPPPIMALANGLIDGNPNMELIGRGVEDRTIRLLVAVNGNQYATQTEREITRLISEGLEPGDITIISLAGQSATNTVIKCPELAHQKLVRADAADATAHVVADTFLRFKGLERPAVIVTDLDDLRVNDRMGTRLHIALTRALDFVRIVGTAADFEKCGLLAEVLKMQQEISSKKAQAEAAAKAEQPKYRK